jgi:hypothetical protein
MIATESRQYTTADFEEIRPGVFRLKGHHVYAAGHGLKEACEPCEGKGKVQGLSASGRKVWRKCGWCHGRGQVDPLRNIERGVPRTGTHIVTMASDLDDLVRSLNRDTAGYLKQPTYVSLYH